MISGFVLFAADDLKSVISFANSLAAIGDISDIVYDASFASINLANGLADANKLRAQAAGNASVAAYSNLLNAAWRANAYKFCTNGCKGIVVINSYDTYNSVINGANHQLINGSCNDISTISDDAWSVNFFDSFPNEFLRYL